MKRNKNYSQGIRLYYYRYKDFIAPLLIIITCIILFFAIILPQFEHFLSVRRQISTESDNFHILQQNFQRVSSLNDQELATQFTLSSSALPAEKDVVGILNTISVAAGKANASLQDYNFQPGDIVSSNETSSITVNLNIIGSISTIQQFIHELKNGLPLSDVTSITDTGNTADVTVVFYAKPFTKASFDDSVPLQLLSQQDQATLTTLESWQKSQ